MDYQVSARKWRPQTFDEVIGQEHVTTSLTNAIRLDKIAQAYLFSGIRGVGKTSLARILAKGVNCKRAGDTIPCNQCELCEEITEGRFVDVVEIDGASNTGVDDVRELRENVKYLPLRGRYKVYIIDEVHMLSNAAFNALLKTLEEPPPHLIFILATTESHKIPGTILSRCQHFAFRRMTASEIVTQLRLVIDEKQVQFTTRGLNLIARVAEGSMRDALSLLDQAISFGGESVTDEDLFMLLGRMDGITFHRLVEAIHKKDAAAALAVARDITDQGCDLRQFLTDWLEHLRNLVVAQNVSDTGLWVALSSDEIEVIQKEAALFSLEAMQRLFTLFAKLLSEIRNAPQPNLLFEVALMKAMLLADTQSIERVIEKLDRLSAGQPDTPENAGETAHPSTQKPGPTAEPPAKTPETTRAQHSQKTDASVSKEAEPDSTAALPMNQSGWTAFIKQIKQERPNVASYLEQGMLDHFDEKEIRVAFSKNSAFLIPLIQKQDTQTWLRDLLKTHFKTRIQLVLVEKETKQTPRAGSEKRNPLPEATTEAASGVQHPLIQEALKVMGGSIVETKRVMDEE